MLKSISNPLIHFASFACVVHCIVTPLLILITPFTACACEAPWLELGLFLFSVICGILIIYNGYRMHKKRYPLALFAGGVLLWTIHAFLGHHDASEAQIVLLAGTALVLISYYINHRLLKHCPSECCSDS